MKKKRTGVIFALLAALSMTLFAAAAEPGSSADPLVTLSYLNETYWNQLLAQVDAKIAQRNAALSLQPGGGTVVPGGADFSVVTLSQGQTLYGAIGCEVMLRVGTAGCVSPSSPGLIDETSGGVLDSGGALAQNHMYMMTIDGRGVQASSGTVKLLVRGGYTIG